MVALDEVLSTAPPRVLDLSVQPRGPDLQLGRSCVAVVVLSRTRDTGRINPLGAENGNEQLFQIESRRYGRNATIGLILVVAGTVLEAVPPFCTAWGSRRRRPNAAMPQTARESPMDPRVGEGPQLRAEAHHAAIDVIDAAPERIKLNQHWTENPEMVGLAVVGGVIRQQMAEVPFPNTTTWSRHSRRIEPISRST